jgi:hypothetical protein
MLWSGSFRQASGNSGPVRSAYYVPTIAAGKLPDVAAGEAMHQRGAEGARRAKRRLDATTRTRTSWVNEDTVRAGKLEFPWPHGGESFSFDVGGMLIGEPFGWHNFVAEVEFYSGDDLGPPFDNFWRSASLCGSATRRMPSSSCSSPGIRFVSKRGTPRATRRGRPRPEAKVTRAVSRGAPAAGVTCTRRAAGRPRRRPPRRRRRERRPPARCR